MMKIMKPLKNGERERQRETQRARERGRAETE